MAWSADPLFTGVSSDRIQSATKDPWSLGMPTDIISLTEFKNDASGWIERLQNQPPGVLTQNGRGKAVVQSYESYQQQRFALALLKRVIQGQADAAAGRAIPHEQVMADVHALINAEMAKHQPARPRGGQPAPRKAKRAPGGRRGA
jgi:prevent-host-death family protein